MWLKFRKGWTHSSGTAAAVGDILDVSKNLAEELIVAEAAEECSEPNSTPPPPPTPQVKQEPEQVQIETKTADEEQDEIPESQSPARFQETQQVSKQVVSKQWSDGENKIIKDNPDTILSHFEPLLPNRSPRAISSRYKKIHNRSIKKK